MRSGSINRHDILGNDVTGRIDPHRGDAGGAEIVFREEFVARWLTHARCNANHIRGGDVKPNRVTQEPQ
jgi:hypothetical protein